MPVSTCPQPAVSSSQHAFSAASGQNTTLLQPNPTRKGFSVYNDDTSACYFYVLLGVGASLSSYTVELRPSDYYESPFLYTGQVDAWPNGTTGSIRVTEFF